MGVTALSPMSLSLMNNGLTDCNAGAGVGAVVAVDDKVVVGIVVVVVDIVVAAGSAIIMDIVYTLSYNLNTR